MNYTLMALMLVIGFMAGTIISSRIYDRKMKKLIDDYTKLIDELGDYYNSMLVEGI